MQTWISPDSFATPCMQIPKILGLILLNLLISAFLIVAALLAAGLGCYTRLKTLFLRNREQQRLGVHSEDGLPLGQSTADITVIAIHGTFAQGAQWTKTTSALSKKIRAGIENKGRTLAWHCLSWTGGNRVTDRNQAVALLHAALDTVLTSSPERPVILLAHSHGGNIALKAAESFTRHKNLHIVTMATPFLFAQPRPDAERLISVVGCCCVIVSFLAGWLLLALIAPLYGMAPFGLASLAAGFIMFILILYIFARDWDAIDTDRERVLRATPDPGKIMPLASRTLICTRAGDEADGAIKVAALISGWISQQMRLARFAPMNFKVGTLTQCEYLLKLLAGAACMTVLHRVVGTSTALAAATVAISSSETPPGRWEHAQSLQSVGASALLLGHSQIYGDEQVVADIARWIRQRTTGQAGGHS